MSSKRDFTSPIKDSQLTFLVEKKIFHFHCHSNGIIKGSASHSCLKIWLTRIYETCTRLVREVTLIQVGDIIISTTNDIQQEKYLRLFWNMNYDRYYFIQSLQGEPRWGPYYWPLSLINVEIQNICEKYIDRNNKKLLLIQYVSQVSYEDIYDIDQIYLNILFAT